MDLEHTKLGLHCDVKDCHQRDFLPFTCDSCSKHLCAEHRHYSAHACNGGNMKDMTSIDCPLCGKSVRFVKADNPDLIWDDHYVNSCTKQMAKPQPVHKCYEKSCRITLGPSNILLCGKCKQNVCLSHRIAEDHHCEGMRGAILSKLPVSAVNPPKTIQSYSNNIASSKPTSTASKVSNDKPKTKSSTISSNSALNAVTKPINTVFSTISNAATKTSSTGSSSNFECPFCNIKMADPTALQNHINASHPDNNSSSSHAKTALQPSPIVNNKTITTTNTGNNNLNARAREVCPVCNARFIDPIELVTHFETAHPPAVVSSQNHQQTGRSTAECVLG